MTCHSLYCDMTWHYNINDSARFKLASSTQAHFVYSISSIDFILESNITPSTQLKLPTSTAISQLFHVQTHMDGTRDVSYQSSVYETYSNI